MKKITTQPVETISVDDVDFRKPIGFVDNEHNKGYFVFCGQEDKDERPILHAVSTRRTLQVPNPSFGSLEKNQYLEFPKDLKLKGTKSEITEAYQFDTLQELHKWLSE